MRRASLVLLLVLCAGSPASADEPAPTDRAFVEMTTPKDAVFVQERLRLVLRFGVDAEFFRASAVPLFRQRLDVPVLVAAPGLRTLAEAIVLAPGGDAAPDGPPRPRFALDDGAVEADTETEEVRGGRAFRVLTMERTFLPEAPGVLSIPAPTLRFAYATKFQEDFVNGRVAVDRHEVTVVGAPISIRVRALPEEGRPPEFHGAVGRFAVTAAIDRARVAVGETLRLTLRIEGEGNLEVLETPRLDDLQGFHVYGTIEDRGPRRRTIAYDVAALGPDVVAVPPVPFAFFDPAPPAGYRVVHTERLPLEVTAPAGAPATAGTDAAGAARSRPAAPTAVVLGLVALGAIGVAVAWRRRARRRAPVDPALARARAAAVALRARAAEANVPPSDVLAEYLAALLQCAPAAVIAPDLSARLGGVGVPPALADRAASTLERLVAERYGGGDAGHGRDDLASLATAIEASFEAAPRA